MPSHITVVPASTKAGRETIRVLLASENKPLVRGIYRDPAKAPTDFTENPNFEAAKGDVGTGEGLDFSRSDAVFYIPPPTYDGTDEGEWGVQTGTNMKKALGDAPSVKRLLILSAMGSQYDHSIGILRLNHISDEMLKDTVPEVVIVRPSYFQEDFIHMFETAQADPPVIYSWITPLDYEVPMISLKDISEYCAKSLIGDFAGPSPKYLKLFGPRKYSSLDLKKAVVDIIGKDVELKAVEKDELAGFFGRMFPEKYVQEFVDMTTAVMPGGIMAGDFEYDENTYTGRVELVDALRSVYKK